MSIIAYSKEELIPTRILLQELNYKNKFTLCIFKEKKNVFCEMYYKTFLLGSFGLATIIGGSTNFCNALERIAREIGISEEIKMNAIPLKETVYYFSNNVSSTVKNIYYHGN